MKMTVTEREKLVAVLEGYRTGLWSNSRREPITGDLVAIYEDALRGQTMPRILEAIRRHIADTERGHRFPAPADIVRHCRVLAARDGGRRKPDPDDNLPSAVISRGEVKAAEAAHRERYLKIKKAAGGGIAGAQAVKAQWIKDMREIDPSWSPSR